MIRKMIMNYSLELWYDQNSTLSIEKEMRHENVLTSIH